MSGETSFAEIEHWVNYGRGGSTPPVRVRPDAWKTKPMLAAVIAPWDLAVSPTHLARLLLGSRPEAMEDKWFICGVGPDARGNVSVNFYRSWTGFHLAELQIKVPLDPQRANGALARDGARVTALVWEAHGERVRGQTEAKARETVLGCCRHILGIDLLEP